MRAGGMDCDGNLTNKTLSMTHRVSRGGNPSSLAMADEAGAE